MGKQPEKLIRPLVLTAAALGIVQSLVWLGLSITAIVLYFVGLENTSDRNLGYFIYNVYLDSNTDSTVSGYIISSKQFNYFMYIYLVFSLAWFVISSIILWVVLKKPNKDKLYNGSILAWIIIVSLTALLDLILLILLSCDYNRLKSAVSSQDVLYQMFIVAIGIVMALAARGFLLWIINVIFIVILSKHYYQRYKGSVENQPIIDAFSTGSRLPPWQSEPLEFDNKGYRNDDTLHFPSMQSQFIEDRNDYNREMDRNNFNNRSLPQVNLKKPNYNDNNYNNRDAGNRLQPRLYNEPDSVSPYGQQQQPPRTAKIGRQGGQRSPPLNVSSPYIPDPDYSPPGSPQIRGVLRPKSNYMMY